MSEVAKTLKKLADLAFAPPYDSSVEKGGLSGIKKALATEKNRYLLDVMKGPAHTYLLIICDMSSV